MVEKSVPEDIKNMSFEDALHELESIVDGLEQVLENWMRRSEFMNVEPSSSTIVRPS